MATRKEVADRAGVSVAVVSYVLNNRTIVKEETRRKVQDAIRELGYRPNLTARSLKTKKTQQVAVLTHYIGNPFEAGLLLQIEATAKQHGYFVFVQTYEPDREEELRSMLMGRVDGILLLGQSFGEETLGYFDDLQVPVVSAMKPAAWDADGSNPIPYVDIDWLPAMRSLVSHLRQRGHEKIAFMTAKESQLNYAVRHQAFLEAMRLEGLELQEDGHLDGSGRFEQAQAVLGELLDAEGKGGTAAEFTAIVCANDLMAAGCLAACRERGVPVPQDIAVAGCENILMSSQTWPPLTVIHYPRQAAGEMAMNMLLDRMNGIKTESILLSGSLIVRAST
ncbi:LacI family DNA-binding transcriptional regulator [Cohnella lupini]|uniref:LacI family transcriptional regulator n=1 Tax=Cohnella lupini TaxID=1294267 RepID=A0A3D9HQX5_9BACL|nr:LacI family DNA-binding transcriptional regulator [Cohnella lupini]RED51878.1 LacI family transcriptional regulator [Cohnella lupini]